jgi:hypothetical protein
MGAQGAYQPKTAVFGPGQEQILDAGLCSGGGERRLPGVETPRPWEDQLGVARGGSDGESESEADGEGDFASDSDDLEDADGAEEPMECERCHQQVLPSNYENHQGIFECKSLVFRRGEAAGVSPRSAAGGGSKRGSKPSASASASAGAQPRPRR